MARLFGSVWAGDLQQLVPATPAAFGEHIPRYRCHCSGTCCACGPWHPGGYLAPCPHETRTWLGAEQLPLARTAEKERTSRAGGGGGGGGWRRGHGSTSTHKLEDTYFSSCYQLLLSQAQSSSDCAQSGLERRVCFVFRWYEPSGAETAQKGGGGGGGGEGKPLDVSPPAPVSAARP